MKRLFYIAVCLVIAVSAFAASQQVSSTTAATMIDRTEARLNDAENRMWLAGDLLSWLNEGQLDIVTRTHCLENTETETLVADQVEYPLDNFDSSVTYITIKAVLYIDSNSEAKALTKGTIIGAYQNTNDQSLGNADDPDEPAFWYEWSGSVGIYPTLSAIDGVTAETIKIYYITRPVALVSTDNITIPAIYEPALIYYMMAQAYLRDNKMNRYLQTIAIYEQEMKRIRVDLNEMSKGTE